VALNEWSFNSCTKLATIGLAKSKTALPETIQQKKLNKKKLHMSMVLIPAFLE